MRRFEPLPRTLSTVETWGFGFTVLLFWIVVAPELHRDLGAAALLAWVPATLAGIVITLQVRRLALHRLDAAGGSPVHLARLWADRPSVARWAALAYVHSWAIVPPAMAWIVGDLVSQNLLVVGIEVPALAVKLLILTGIFATAFTGVRVLSVVHLCFLIPSIGLLALLGTQGALHYALGAGSATVSILPQAGIPGWAPWLAAYFLVAYTTYGIETAAAFTADSQNPRATLAALPVAALLSLPIMIGGSWLLAVSVPAGLEDVESTAILEALAQPIWGGWTPALVTFMVASSCLLACATSVAITPRVLWQLGRDGLLHPRLGRLGGPGVPRLALGVVVVLALLHLGLDPVTMVLVGGSSWVAFWTLMHLGLWRSRGRPRQAPHWGRGSP